MSERAIQDYYPEQVAHCYGCGRLNEHGLHIKSYWDGAVSVCTFKPEPYHIAIPGYVYGGLIASIIDCHGIGTAAAVTSHAAGGSPEENPPPRFVTASLHVDYVKPTPLGIPLEVRAEVEEQTERKVVVGETVYAEGEVCARGRVVAVRMPAAMVE